MMAHTGSFAFSQDGQYFAYCGNDGKLKIWETTTNRLKHEHVPNLHLSSPCSVLCWITVGQQSASTSPLPWKRRKKKSIAEEAETRGIVAMGSVNGSITLYDIATASVNTKLENGHSSSITAITWSAGSGLYSAGQDHHIIEWNLQENAVKCKWKSGKTKVTALAVMKDGASLISAERLIKWWDLSTKQLIRTFTGHASQVYFLNPIKLNDKTNYLISGADGDGYLCIWALSEHKNDKACVATLVVQDDATSISVNVVEESSSITVLASNRSGQVQIFKYQPNGHSSKPSKPSLTVTVASDSNHKESIQQVPILSAKLTEDQKLLLAYGSFLNLTFEKVVPDFSDKVQCLVRNELKKSKREDNVSKTKSTMIDGEVEYVAPGSTTTPMKRIKGEAGTQLPLKDRLENLSLNAETNTARKTKGLNMTQLLLQGLNSKDRSILNNVLFTKNENVIQNTISKLPIQAIVPLLKELTTMVQGKTYVCQIAVMWLQALISTHAAHLLSHPDIGDSLSPILSVIDAKLMLLPNLSRLRGRISLITGQISRNNEKNSKDITEESLLVYQDPDSSDESSGMGETDLNTESDDNWEENSEQEEQDQQNEEDIKNTKSEDDMDSMCS